MSTTDPTPGSDPERHHAPTPPGQPAADDHDRSGPPDASVIKRGYEEDRYDTTSVLSVPVIVVVFFVLAFGCVTVMFRYLAPDRRDPNAHPLAVDRNSATLNDRMDRIHRGGEVDQPRLEPLKLRSGDSRAITRPELPTGNSPELHPEDLRPSAVNTPVLYKSGWLDANKTVARITIDDAMDIAAQGKYLPARKDGKPPAQPHEGPTAANAGRGLPVVAPPPHKAEGKN